MPRASLNAPEDLLKKSRRQLLKALHGRSACRGDALTLRSAGGLTHFDRGAARMTAHRYSALLSCSVGRRAYVTVTVVILVLFATPIFAATTVAVGSDPTKVVIKGILLVTANQVVDGEPVFEGDMITCVAVMGVAPAGATRMTVTDAFIFPGSSARIITSPTTS